MEHEYTVVVGMPAHRNAENALRWAVQQAEAHGGRVLAVRAWKESAPPPATTNPAPSTRPSTSAVEQQLQGALARQVQEVVGDAATPVLVRGGRRSSLVRASRDADLVVVEAPARTDLKTSPTWVSRLSYSAHCPVVVLGPKSAPPPPTVLSRAGKGLARAAAQAGRPGMRTPPTR